MSNQSNPMPPFLKIPTELVMRIGCCLDTGSISNLCLTSNEICKIVQPLLFHDITLANSGSESNSAYRKQLRLLLLELAHSQKSASHVKHLTLRGLPAAAFVALDQNMVHAPRSETVAVLEDLFRSIDEDGDAGEPTFQARLACREFIRNTWSLSIPWANRPSAIKKALKSLDSRGIRNWIKETNTRDEMLPFTNQGDELATLLYMVRRLKSLTIHFEMEGPTFRNIIDGRRVYDAPVELEPALVALLADAAGRTLEIPDPSGGPPLQRSRARLPAPPLQHLEEVTVIGSALTFVKNIHFNLLASLVLIPSVRSFTLIGKFHPSDWEHGEAQWPRTSNVEQLVLRDAFDVNNDSPTAIGNLIGACRSLRRASLSSNSPVSLTRLDPESGECMITKCLATQKKHLEHLNLEFHSQWQRAEAVETATSCPLFNEFEQLKSLRLPIQCLHNPSERGDCEGCHLISFEARLPVSLESLIVTVANMQIAQHDRCLRKRVAREWPLPSNPELKAHILDLSTGFLYALEDFANDGILLSGDGGLPNSTLFSRSVLRQQALSQHWYALRESSLTQE